MPLEIERRFLVDADLGMVAARADRIHPVIQGYLSVEDPEVRLRRSARGCHVIGVKAGTGLARREVEFDIGDDVARQLWPLVVGHVEKTRYHLARWEIDVYGGVHEGLVIAEIELASVLEALPEWPAGVEVVQEVTEEAHWSNRSLAVSGWDWRGWHPRWQNWVGVWWGGQQRDGLLRRNTTDDHSGGVE